MTNERTSNPDAYADLESAPGAHTDHVVFGDLRNQPGLWPRGRSLITAARRLLILVILVTAAACGAHATTSSDDAARGRPGRATVVTFEEMQRRGQHSSLHTLIQDLRPRWLRSQGPDTFLGLQGQVQVRMDGNHLGGVDVLRRMSAHGVTSIEWLGPIDAAARYGPNHSHGAIIISTEVIH